MPRIDMKATGSRIRHLRDIHGLTNKDIQSVFRFEELVRRLSNHLTNIFAGISATVAITPIPIADMYVLVVLQGILVTLIASLSGRDISLENSRRRTE